MNVRSRKLELLTSTALLMSSPVLAGAVPQTQSKDRSGQVTAQEDSAQDATSQYQLALRYARGDGVMRDDAASARLLRTAAEAGLAEAQGALGFAYHLGRGVQQNDLEAVKWFRKAAEQGLASAQFNLGFAYFT